MAMSYATDIRPLFRQLDVDSMKDYGIDLSSYNDVKKHSKQIHGRLKAGEMPCDGGWPAANVEKFKSWIDGGLQP
jgi:hypothetical protein